MIWFTIIIGIIQLLVALFRWLREKKAAGQGLTGREKKKLQELIDQFQELEDLAVGMGCQRPKSKG